jgi:hypothetical protein
VYESLQSRRATIVVAEGGVIMLTTDAVNWERRRSPYEGELRAIY